MPKVNLMIRSWMERSFIMAALFKVVGVFGVALLLAGMLDFMRNSRDRAAANRVHRRNSHTSTVTSWSNSRVSLHKQDLVGHS